jgi:hypothetical protein
MPHRRGYPAHILNSPALERRFLLFREESLEVEARASTSAEDETN